MNKKEIIAKDRNEWIQLMRQKHNIWNSLHGNDDQIPFNEFICEYIGTSIFGWDVVNFYDDWEIIKSK